MGHLSSCTAPLCCDMIVQYSTLLICAQSLLCLDKKNFQNQWWVLSCLGIMSSTREYEGRLGFDRKLSRGGPLNSKWKLILTVLNQESFIYHSLPRKDEHDLMRMHTCSDIN